MGNFIHTSWTQPCTGSRRVSLCLSRPPLPSSPDSSPAPSFSAFSADRPRPRAPSPPPPSAAPPPSPRANGVRLKNKSAVRLSLTQHARSPMGGSLTNAHTHCTHTCSRPPHGNRSVLVSCPNHNHKSEPHQRFSHFSGLRVPSAMQIYLLEVA